ncbi:MAG: Re/Si-specific NAD(P)(+) transhydrogenase subunit alpha, partial [Planctomycetota bacterium]|nr:Re/Si-specific NAD(P)(+) transhydrogenase subunit alpha [Planctomycetota bacterium]
GERRVAATPETCGKLKKAGFEVFVENGAGEASSFGDSEYREAGASLTTTDNLYEQADIIAKVSAPTDDETGRLRSGVILIALLNPLSNGDLIRRLAEQRVDALAMELMPRITRAQKMDALSAMSTVTGYSAVLIAASKLNRFFPMFMTAAGTIKPAKVLVLGAGVAGLQAIATAKRLGAVVEVFDVRPAVKEQVESLGARFVEVEAPAQNAEDAGGYAKEMSDDYKLKQKETIAAHVKVADVVISTALIPGKPAPVLITRDMVESMRPDTVIVDLAGEAGGNCELSKFGESVLHGGVVIEAPMHLASSLSYHASQMYARTMAAFVLDVSKDGTLNLDPENEIIAGTLVTRGGDIFHERVRATLGEAQAGGGT